jgi:hypothetical protein
LEQAGGWVQFSMKRLKTLKSLKIFKSEIKKLKPYSGWCAFKGLSNDTTFMQIQSGRTVPLNLNLRYIFEIALYILFAETKKSGGSTLSYMIKRRYGWTCKIFCSYVRSKFVLVNKYNANPTGVTLSEVPSDTKLFGCSAKGHEHQSDRDHSFL